MEPAANTGISSGFGDQEASAADLLKYAKDSDILKQFCNP